MNPLLSRLIFFVKGSYFTPSSASQIPNFRNNVTIGERLSPTGKRPARPGAWAAGTTLGFPRQNHIQPRWSCVIPQVRAQPPAGLDGSAVPDSRVARAAQPFAPGRNPVGIQAARSHNFGLRIEFTAKPPRTPRSIKIPETCFHACKHSLASLAVHPEIHPQSAISTSEFG